MILGLTAAAAEAPRVTVALPPAPPGPSMLVVVTGVGMVLTATALVSWLAALYLNWAIAPRRFGARVAAAGLLPAGILTAVIVMIDLSRGQGIVPAMGALARIPATGQLLMLAMVLTGLCAAWLTAMRRKRRDSRQAIAAIEVFE